MATFLQTDGRLKLKKPLEILVLFLSKNAFSRDYENFEFLFRLCEIAV